MDQERFGQFYQSKVWRSEQHPYLIKQLLSRSGLQRTYTPVELCTEIIGKLSGYANLANSQILVLFNLEFVDTLIRVFRVNPANITYFADSELEARAARKWYNVECPTELIVWDTENKKIIMPNIKKQFDVVVMNPPYQGQSEGGGEGRNNLLWPSFIEKSLELCKDGGFLSHVHPPLWRKPEHAVYKKLSCLDMIFLSMNSKSTGQKVFGASTQFDWYVIRKAKSSRSTTIVDFNGERAVVDLTILPFLPNSNISFILKLVAGGKDEKLSVLYSTKYHNQGDNNRESPDKKFEWPVVHSIISSGPRIMYAPENKGMFGVKNKVIVSTGEILYSMLDLEGKYGMTEGCFAILCDSPREAEKVKKAIDSETFANKVIKPTKWSNIRIDYKMFSCFRKDFWKEFI